jgi:restriction system protein
MAKRRSWWSEIQRERARQQRLATRTAQAYRQEQIRVEREHERARRAAEREAAANERERRRLYVESRKAEAAELTADIRERLAELDSILVSGLDGSTWLTFAAMKRTANVPPFDAGGLDRPIPPPRWEDFAPPPMGPVGRVFGSGRRQREEAAARQRFDDECARHSQAEWGRQRELTRRRRAYNEWAASVAAEVGQHNADVDQFEWEFRSGESDAAARFFTLVLDSCAFPSEFPHQTRALYRPEPKELVVEYELPPQAQIPAVREYKYVQTRDEIDELKRPIKEVKEQYGRLIAQVALRMLHEVFTADTDGTIAVASFNGHVSTTDPATGQPVRPCLISVAASRDVFDTLVLRDLDPVSCLRHLNALVSLHPYDLEAVRPVVDFEALLTQYKFVEGMDAVAGLDSRPDLLDMTPTEFEHLTRQLFEAMGMKSWATQASKDDGVDAVAVNEDPVFGGLCVIQAKRYRSAVGVEAVRALAGVMEDKHATKGVLVTTSWVTKDGHAFAQRHGRIQVMECEELKFLCKEHLDRDVLISLPKPPPRRRERGAGVG